MGSIMEVVAKAVGWVHTNIARYGGHADRILLMGHSAGAQRGALPCRNGRCLEAEGVPRSSIKGCVPLEGDTHDLPLQVATARRKSLNHPAPKMGHPEKFGNLERQRALSAVNYFGPNEGIPPFLLLHVPYHIDTTVQAYRLWAALDQAGVQPALFGAEGTDHVKLDRELGLAGDPATLALFDFSSRVLREVRG